MLGKSARTTRKRKSGETEVDSNTTAIQQPSSKRSKPSNTTSSKANLRSKHEENSASSKKSNTVEQNMSNATDNDISVATSSTSTSTPKPTLTLRESTGDIFSPSSPPPLLIHACNCHGSWGAGIALAFKTHYPRSYQIYHNHCLDSTPSALIGTALLIPPQTGDAGGAVWVGCLFTSRGKGKTKDSPDRILAATEPAMRDLMRKVNAVEGGLGEVRMCQINSGLFAVPWEETKAALEGIVVADEDVVREVRVITRE